MERNESLKDLVEMVGAFVIVIGGTFGGTYTFVRLLEFPFEARREFKEYKLKAEIKGETFTWDDYNQLTAPRYANKFSFITVSDPKNR